MPAYSHQRLEEIRAERARQDGAWEHAQRVLAQLGDATIFVPDELLEAIEASSIVATECPRGLRG